MGRKLLSEGSPSSMKTVNEGNTYVSGVRGHTILKGFCKVRLPRTISEHRAHDVCHFWACQQ